MIEVLKDLCMGMMYELINDDRKLLARSVERVICCKDDC